MNTRGCVVCADIIYRVKHTENPPFRPTVPSYKALLFSLQYYQLMERCWAEKPTDRPDFTRIVLALRSFTALKSVTHA